MCNFQVSPGEEKDLKPLYDGSDSPFEKIVIEFTPIDSSKKITLDEVPKLKICTYPSM